MKNNLCKMIYIFAPVIIIIIIIIFIMVKNTNSLKNSLVLANEQTVIVSEKYGIKKPDFSLKLEKYHNYYFVSVCFEDVQFYSLNKEQKFKFIKELGEIRLNNIIFINPIKIYNENFRNYDDYYIDGYDENFLYLNGRSIYEFFTEKEKYYIRAISTRLPELKMREKYLKYTLLGKPSRIEKSFDFDAKTPLHRHKVYYWDDKDFKVQVNYTYNIDGTVYGNKECPTDNGYVWSIQYKEDGFYIREDLMGVNFTLE